MPKLLMLKIHLQLLKFFKTGAMSI